jgi:hypothetical protein
MAKVGDDGLTRLERKLKYEQEHGLISKSGEEQIEMASRFASRALSHIRENEQRRLGHKPGDKVMAKFRAEGWFPGTVVRLIEREADLYVVDIGRYESIIVTPAEIRDR